MNKNRSAKRKNRRAAGARTGVFHDGESRKQRKPFGESSTNRFKSYTRGHPPKKKKKGGSSFAFRSSTMIMVPGTPRICLAKDVKKGRRSTPSITKVSFLGRSFYDRPTTPPLTCFDRHQPCHTRDVDRGRYPPPPPPRLPLAPPSPRVEGAAAGTGVEMKRVG